jgi:hypothetical protein
VVGVEQQRSAAIQHHEILEERQLQAKESVHLPAESRSATAMRTHLTLPHFTVHFRQQFGQAGKAFIAAVVLDRLIADALPAHQ